MIAFHDVDLTVTTFMLQSGKPSLQSDNRLFPTTIHSTTLLKTATERIDINDNYSILMRIYRQSHWT